MHQQRQTHTHTHTHTHARTHTHRHTHTPIWILLEQETVSGSSISSAICKSAPCSRQITTPAPHHSVFYRPDALTAAQLTASKQWRHQQTKYAVKTTRGDSEDESMEAVPAWWVTPEKLYCYRPQYTQDAFDMERCCTWSHTCQSLMMSVGQSAASYSSSALVSYLGASQSLLLLPSATAAITGRTKPFFHSSFHFGIAGQHCKTTQSHCICITAHVPLACH